MNNRWRKSSYSSGNENCVELDVRADTTRVRDSKAPNGGQFTVDASQWAGFLTAIRTGGFKR